MPGKCDTCRNLDPLDPTYSCKWTSGPVFEDTFIKLSDVTNTLRQCNICSLLAVLVDDFVPEWRSKFSIDKISLHVTAPVHRPLEVRISQWPDPASDDELPRGQSRELANVFLSAVQGINVPALPLLGTHRPISQTSYDPQCFQFIRDRLDTCRLHRECSGSVEALLPTRVVDLGLDNGGISLHKSNNETGVYAALSYCWGGSGAVLKTTLSNIDAFRRCIPWSQLPKTLQDAISICREIGLKFLWIDSLCIVQDVRTDWEVEAAKMGQYYQNAFLTIGASASESALSGIFKDRPKISRPREIQFPASEGAAPCPLIAQTRDVILHPSTILDLGPWSQRGWTLQEHGLSKRMVHYTESEIIWECRTEMVSEDGCPIRDNCHSLIREFRQELEADPEGYWRLLVRAYSDRNLTFAEDKLPAISGIAIQFQRKTGYQYLAGLWKETLPIDLVWSSWGWVNAATPPETLRGPSWSWTSIGGGIAFDMETIASDVPLDVHSTVSNAQCTVEERNPFGKPSKGSLDITGPLLEMTLHYDGQETDDFGVPKFQLSHGPSSEFTFFPDTSLERTEIRGRDGSQTWTVRRTSAPPSAFQATVWCCWIFTAHQEPSDLQEWFGVEPLKLHGLVLARSGSSAETYNRVGSVATKDVGMLDKAF